MDDKPTHIVPVPAAARPTLAKMLAAKAQIDLRIATYLNGVLDGMGESGDLIELNDDGSMLVEGPLRETS